MQDAPPRSGEGRGWQAENGTMVSQCIVCSEPKSFEMKRGPVTLVYGPVRIS
jgi:hypothetical protein